MREPYGKVLNSKVSMFNRLGFSRLAGSEYLAIFSNNCCSIEISVERYYVPSIATKFIDQKGNKYSMRIIRQILDLNKLEKDLEELEDLKKKYMLENEKTEESMHRKGIEEYVTLSINQLLDFLSIYADTLIVIDGAFRVEYQKRNQNSLARIGL